ncbi:Diguanylate cyclase/phosphodiesterase (fragment) [Frankia canadensis]|uniref:Diguanylate cyclase/phosphodiesterase n=1 Tax=Frankia canadensis TaxID=1836972 RepID=A0A2I2KZR2_9ACTN
MGGTNGVEASQRVPRDQSGARGPADTAAGAVGASVTLPMFASGGEVGRLAATLDWSVTDLGPVCDWPLTLRTMVTFCLECRFPMHILWGPGLIQLYNDALIAQIGEKHPAALGRPFFEAFSELRGDLAPMIAGVVAGHGSVLRQDHLTALDRYGYLEECYFTYSCSPIRDPSGNAVLGVLFTSQDTTRRVLTARRLACLRELAGTLSGQSSPREVFVHAAASLARNAADVPYCLVLVPGPGDEDPLVPVATGGLDAAARPGVTTRALPQGPVPELTDTLAMGQTRQVGSVLERFGLRRQDETPPSTAALVTPLAESETSALLVTGMSAELPVDRDYRTFVALAASQIAAAAATARSVERERVTAKEARRRALLDGLTGLPNRTAMFERLDRAVETARLTGRHVGCLFVDLDGFKEVNDTLGHQAGDELLCEVAARLRQVVRPRDTVARISGDEFVVLCEDVTSDESVEAIAARLVDGLTIRRRAGPREIMVTASVGLATTGPRVVTSDDLVGAADHAMYAAKRRGRDCWQRYGTTSDLPYHHVFGPSGHRAD